MRSDGGGGGDGDGDGDKAQQQSQYAPCWNNVPFTVLSPHYSSNTAMLQNPKFPNCHNKRRHLIPPLHDLLR